MKMTSILAVALLAGMAQAADPGFVDLFDGKSLKGWKLNGGSAEYSVQDGVIAGVGVPGTPGNTFLCTEKDYENFIFRAEFKCPSGNSGIVSPKAKRTKLDVEREDGMSFVPYN